MKVLLITMVIWLVPILAHKAVSETSDKLYTLAVTVPAGPTGNFLYTLTATPVLPDPECLTLTLNQLGEKGSTPPGSTCW